MGMNKDKDHHIVPYSIYFNVWLALLALTVITVAVSYIDMRNVAILTAVLIATPRLGGTIVGSLLIALYLCFAVAVTGFFASLLRSIPGTALLTVGVLIALSILGLIPTIRPWLPSELVGGYDALIAGEDFEYWRAVASAVILSAGAIGFSVYRMQRREV